MINQNVCALCYKSVSGTTGVHYLFSVLDLGEKTLRWVDVIDVDLGAEVA